MPSHEDDYQLQLKVGLILQLQSERFPDSRLNAKLIGYLVNEAVIVTMPTMAQGSFEFREGDRFVCRALSGRVALAFRTHVIQVTRTPFPHLYLAYPTGVETATVRKALRLPVQQQVALKKNAAASEEQEQALLVDISLLGAGAVAKAQFAAVSDALVLLLPPLQSGGAEVAIPVTVRSMRPLEEGAAATAPQCYYGLEFGDLGNEGLRAVDRVIQEQLKRGGGF
jgi:hypothetical protein